MNSYEQILVDLVPFTPVEQAYKYIYEHQLSLETAFFHPVVQSIIKVDALSEKIVRGTLNNLTHDPNLRESVMFTPDVDVRINLHPRYHPAINHSHDFFEIQYVLSGELNQTIAGHDMKLHPGDFCFIAPNVPHMLLAFTPNIYVLNLLIKRKVFTYAFSTLLSSEDLISNFFIRAIYSRNFYPYLINQTGSDSTIQDLIARLIDTAKINSTYTPRLLRTQFESLFLFLLRDHSKDFVSPSTNKKSQQKIIAMLSYLQENYTTTSLSDLAARFGYNSSYLSRALRDYTGKSFSQLLQDIRFEQAVLLLGTTDNNIESVIEDIGYADRSFFYREFKKRYGLSPAEYRKRINMKY